MHGEVEEEMWSESSASWWDRSLVPGDVNPHSSCLWESFLFGDGYTLFRGLQQSKGRRSRTRHKKKALHWPVSPPPRPAPPRPPPIPEGTDDDDWTDEDLNSPASWADPWDPWDDYWSVYGLDYDQLCDPDSVYDEDNDT